MTNFIKRFTTFDRLIATTLIKILYWIGLISIGIGTIIYFFMALFMLTRSPAMGLLFLVMVPIGAAISVLFWRFLCEIYIVIFGIYDRLGEIRDQKLL